MLNAKGSQNGPVRTQRDPSAVDPYRTFEARFQGYHQKDSFRAGQYLREQSAQAS